MWKHDSIRILVPLIGSMILVAALDWFVFNRSVNKANDKATFHELCLKAGYSVDECEFEWIKRRTMYSTISTS